MQAHRLLTRELDHDLQSACGISKAEFSVLRTLDEAPGKQLRVTELAEQLDWDKGRVAHQLTRMEARGLLYRSVSDTGTGRRTGVQLTDEGHSTARDAVRRHARNVRHLFFDALAPEEAATIAAWSRQTVESLATADTSA